jgi:hypothetical protein
MTTDNFCFYLQNRLIQTSQKGGQRYSDTSPLVFPALILIAVTTAQSYNGLIYHLILIIFNKLIERDLSCSFKVHMDHEQSARCCHQLAQRLCGQHAQRHLQRPEQAFRL